MARYLVKYPPKTRVAIAAKGADSRAIVELIQEGKVRREDVVVLGIPAVGMKDPKTGAPIDSKTTCDLPNPVLYDVLLGEEIHGYKGNSPYDVLSELEAMDRDARWEFWKRNSQSAFAVSHAGKPAPCVTVIPVLWMLRDPDGRINRLLMTVR